jgi:ABC-type nitrate/sulfonate/bicarbonate transport system substrate-binding protein
MILDFEFSNPFNNGGIRGKKDQLNVRQCNCGGFKMNLYDRPQMWLADQIFVRRRSRPRKPFMIALTVVLLGFSGEVFAQPIKLAYAALSGAQVAAWMAKEGGYLSKYGIESELIYIPAVAATQALIAGEIQLAQVTGVSTSGAILAGADVRIVASSLNRIVGSIYARPEIKTPEDLKGKKIGISRFGALSETAVESSLSATA